MAKWKVVSKQPKPRAEDVRWEDPAPGLYEDGEVLVQIGDIYAAVSVEVKWAGGESGGGVFLQGTARWCDASGETILTEDGRHVETFCNLTVDAVIFERYGQEALQRDVLLLLMGQDPETDSEDVDEDNNKRKVLRPNATQKLEANIVYAANAVKQNKASKSAKELLSS